MFYKIPLNRDQIFILNSNVMKKQISGVEPKPSTQKHEKKKKFSVLQIILTIFGLLYLLFIISNFSPIDNYDPYNLENIFVNLSFVLFLMGYYMVWKNEGVAGIIFIFWWIVMWCLTLFISEHDRGNSVVMGLPLFILGILFIISWYKKRAVDSTKSVTEPNNSTLERSTN